MNMLNDQLAKILSMTDERQCADAFAKFCDNHGDNLPLPGENKLFDKAMFAASQHMTLSKKDESILNRVTANLLGEKTVDVAQTAVLKMRELVGATKDATVDAWRNMLATMAWQQMVPAGAMRGVGTQLVSLGTFQKEINGATVQINLGWHIDKEEVRVLLQANDSNEEGLENVELRVQDAKDGVVFSRKTDEDGAVVAPSVKVGSGMCQIQVIYLDQVASTPFFKI